MDELDGINGMDVIDGLGGRECIDEMCGMCGMDGMVGRRHHIYPIQQSSCDRGVHT